jgi:predicted PurR-regulated permease PerM
MKKVLPFVLGGGLLVIVIIAGVLLYHWDGLVRLRDMSIVFIAALFTVSVLLLAVMVGAFVVVAFLLRDRLIPVLEELNRTASELTQTAQRVKGTTEFVSEQVATPIIGVAKSIARMRAMAKAATGRTDGTDPLA